MNTKKNDIKIKIKFNDKNEVILYKYIEETKHILECILYPHYEIQRDLKINQSFKVL